MAFRPMHIVAKNGARVNIFEDLHEIMLLDRKNSGNIGLSQTDKKTIHRFGSRLIMVAGIEAPLDLVDELFEEGNISSEFAAYLRTAWMPMIGMWTEMASD